MYRDLREKFLWNDMKRDIAGYVARCLTCQQVKAVRQKIVGLLQPLSIPEWKWEYVTMDFVTGLPRTTRNHDSVWVIVDRLTKMAHFIPINKKYSIDRLATLYIRDIVMIYCVLVSIVSDRDARFTSKFWKSLQSALGTRLDFSTTFHPQSDGQSERTIQTLEDMLRACVLNFQGSWDEDLPMVEFAYNNSYQASIQMAPFEAMYGRICRTPTCWSEVGTEKVLATNLAKMTAEKVTVAREASYCSESAEKLCRPPTKRFGIFSG